MVKTNKMSNTPKKEWIGETGYCNCVLVVMFRSSLKEVVLKSNEAPENLEQHASNVPDTLEWVKAQEFNYDELNTSRIIEILMKSAGLKSGIFGKKKGLIRTIVVGDDGSQKEASFKLQLKKTDGAKVLQIQL